jgi:hypothetical protein
MGYKNLDMICNKSTPPWKRRAPPHRLTRVVHSKLPSRPGGVVVPPPPPAILFQSAIRNPKSEIEMTRSPVSAQREYLPVQD